MRDFKKVHNPKLSILGVVGTLVDNRTILHSNILEQCKKFLDHKHIHMFDTKIPRSIRFASSIGFEGLPATMVKENQNNDIVNAYRKLYNEINTNINIKGESTG